MRQGAKPPKPEKLSQVVRDWVAALPWGHHANVLAKVTDPAARLYYLKATAAFGWSRAILLNQIKARAYERTLAEGKTHTRAKTSSLFVPLATFCSILLRRDYGYRLM